MKQSITTRLATSNSVRHQNIFVTAVPDMNRFQLLTETDRVKVLEFLKIRPVQTVVLASFIQDNGLESEKNRGKFYGYRNAKGILEGVALIGHSTLIESRSEDALKAFALAARQSETPIHVMMSDGRTIETFWQYYAGDEKRQPRLNCNELLFELEFPFPVQDCKWDVRFAKPEELEEVAKAQAEVAFMESGVDPLLKDREGFLKRALRRIELKRTYVVYEGDTLVFKADVMAETADVIYLEGVYVNPEHRGQGVGSSCLAKVSLDLLERVEHICLLSNVHFKGAHRSFLKAGYKNTDCSTTIFV